MLALEKLLETDYERDRLIVHKSSSGWHCNYRKLGHTSYASSTRDELVDALLDIAIKVQKTKAS